MHLRVTERKQPMHFKARLIDKHSFSVFCYYYLYFYIKKLKIKISIILPVLISPAPASVPLLSSSFLLRFLEPPNQRPLQQRSHSFRASLTDLKAGALPTLPGQHNDSLCSREITTKPMACSYCWP